MLRRFIPFDVSESTLRSAAGAIVAEYPGLDVHAVVGDFEHHLDLLPTGGRRLIAFLGGTIGNLPPAPRAEFLADVVATMADEDSFLLGTDLVKDAGRLHAAYDDSAGVTAAFNLNLLTRINRELRATFDLTQFRHEAVYNPREGRIEMYLVSERAQQAGIVGHSFSSGRYRSHCSRKRSMPTSAIPQVGTRNRKSASE